MTDRHESEPRCLDYGGCGEVRWRQMPTICLCMIVKDEARVIERCLGSVGSLISYWLICDTGSSDGTPELIRSTLAHVPGELHQRPWVDFGHNRSEALALARGKADYLLLLDADWTFSATSGALDGLSADAYLVRKVYPRQTSIQTYNRQLIRGDREWWCVGVTHEYIATGSPYTEARLQGAVITDWADGAVGRHKRWEQDATLLARAVAQDPADGRSLFYLAQTCRDLGDTNRAIELYARRAKLGGWGEEVFYSLYQVGVLQARLGQWDAAVTALLEAWSARPQRAEALHALANGFRRRGLHPAAHLFAQRALDCPPPDDILFVAPWIYRWGILFEYSITAYHVGDPAAALEACDRLLARDDLPEEYRSHTARNREFCVRALDRPRRGSFRLGGKRVVVTEPPPR